MQMGFFLEAPPGISVCRRQTECCEPGFGDRLYGGRTEVCFGCMVSVRPLVCLAEPGNIGGFSKTKTVRDTYRFCFETC